MADVRIQDFNGILHVCGGDPEVLDIERDLREYSPRVWR